MAAIDFPNSPNDGDLFDAPNGVRYQWVAAKGVWNIVSTGTGASVFADLADVLLTSEALSDILMYDPDGISAGVGAWVNVPNIAPVGGLIEQPSAKSYTLIHKSPAKYRVLELAVQAGSGSGTCSADIDGVAVTGIDAVSITTANNAYTGTALQDIDVGDTLAFTVDSEVSLQDLSYRITLQRIP